MDVVLVDSKNAVYRHGYTRAQLRTTDGKPTGAIFGMLSCLIRLYRYYPDAAFVFCWDGPDTKKSWRHKLCSTYKCRRKTAEEAPPEVMAILKQIPSIKSVLKLLGFAQYEIANIEADDLIGVLATALAKKKIVDRVLIYSMDKDYYGLINDKIHVVRDLDKSMKCVALDGSAIKKEHGVAPRQWVKYRALIGDPSDSIKSPFPKVGKVRAIALLQEGLDPSKKEPATKLDMMFKDHWKKAHTNYLLSKIVTDKDFKLLPAHAKASFSMIVGNVRKNLECIKRNSKCRNRKCYDKFLTYCVNYELNWIIENRHAIFKIGW